MWSLQTGLGYLSWFCLNSLFPLWISEKCYCLGESKSFIRRSRRVATLRWHMVAGPLFKTYFSTKNMFLQPSIFKNRLQHFQDICKQLSKWNADGGHKPFADELVFSNIWADVPTITFVNGKILFVSNKTRFTRILKLLTHFIRILSHE